jgi:hypothetical protein
MSRASRLLKLLEEVTKDQIVQFFKDNPSPSDELVHDFAKQNGIDAHTLEAMIYSLLSDCLSTAEPEPTKEAKDEVDPQELEMGKEVEQEHRGTLTSIIKAVNPEVDDETLEKLLVQGFELIARDHLAELVKYYTLLKKMEQEGKKAQED